jgi:hypothetical protein
MEKPTRIFGDIDYDKNGKQVAHLYLPYSVTRSAYGNIPLPIAVIANGKGPTAFCRPERTAMSTKGRSPCASWCASSNPARSMVVSLS